MWEGGKGCGGNIGEGGIKAGEMRVGRGIKMMKIGDGRGEIGSERERKRYFD